MPKQNTVEPMQPPMKRLAKRMATSNLHAWLFFCALIFHSGAPAQYYDVPCRQGGSYFCERTYSDGAKYSGDWLNGTWHGQGTLGLANGGKYVGEFRHGLRHGLGTLYDPSGLVLQTGIWENGSFVRSQSIVASPAPTPAPAPAPAPVVTVPKVPSGPDSTGSGFRIARGLFITNHHVIDGCSRVWVNGEVARVQTSDSRSDLALVKADVPGPIVRVRGQRIGVGESVAVSGFPLRGLLSGFNMTTGTISSMSGLAGDTRYFQITAPVQPGNSGGPMLDPAGNVAGVVVSKLDALKMARITGDIPQNVNFAINTYTLRSFLDASSMDYGVAGNEPAMPPTNIAERARGFTVLIECQN